MDQVVTEETPETGFKLDLSSVQGAHLRDFVKTAES